MSKMPSGIGLVSKIAHSVMNAGGGPVISSGNIWLVPENTRIVRGSISPGSSFRSWNVK